MSIRGNGVRIRICTCMNGVVVRSNICGMRVRADINIINLMTGTDAAVT